MNEVVDLLIRIANALERGNALAQAHHEAAMSAADADTDRRLEASREDMSAFVTRVLDGMQQHNVDMQEMQREIEALRGMLGAKLS